VFKQHSISITNANLEMLFRKRGVSGVNSKNLTKTQTEHCVGKMQKLTLHSSGST